MLVAIIVDLFEARGDTAKAEEWRAKLTIGRPKECILETLSPLGERVGVRAGSPADARARIPSRARPH